MNDISKKTIGILIDELITTDIKCWFAQEAIASSKDDSEIAIAAKQAQSLNKRRCELIRAIDTAFGNEYTTTEKSY